MPPAYSQPDEPAQSTYASRRISRQYEEPQLYDEREQTITFDQQFGEGQRSGRPLSYHPHVDSGLHAPTPRRALGGSPDFGLQDRPF
jgi:hypothetical protein